MNKNLRWKVLVILAVAALATWAFSPPSRKVRLGLDLKGGVQFVLQVKTDDALRLETQTASEQLRQAAKDKGKLAIGVDSRTRDFTAFALSDRLDRLKAGDRVVLKMPYATATYRVRNHVIVPADDIARLESHGREVVALQACHPRFSAKERYIVYAEPVAITGVRQAAATVAAPAS